MSPLYRVRFGEKPSLVDREAIIVTSLSVNKMVGVVPSRDSSSPNAAWVYDLQPAKPLPTLDLSMSVKSRFLGPSALKRFNRLVQQRKLIATAGWVANASYLATLLAPAGVGRVAAVITLVCWTPPMVSAVSSLRYDVVLLLFQTYDFWFFTCVNVSVFVVLGMLMGDLRAIAMLATCVGVEVNILVDANLRRVKAWFFFNVLAIIQYLITWCAVSFMFIERVRDFPLFRYKHHELPATAFVASGLLTIVALIARNVYRRRGIVLPHARERVIECVVYRTDLQFYPQTSHRRILASGVNAKAPGYLKRMRCNTQVGLVDPRNRLLKIRMVANMNPPTATRSWFFRWLGIGALCAFICSACYDLRLFDSKSLRAGVRVDQLVGLVLTFVYWSMCAAHYQRKLLHALCASFDFLFLSLQVSVVHVSAFVFFEWEFGTTSILASWIWIHWVLGLDALPPVVKRKLGLQKSFTVVVLAVSIALNILLVYLLMHYDHKDGDGMDNFASEMYDHVIWETRFSGRHLQFRLVALFVNSFVTTFLLVLRLLWRLVWHKCDVLLVLNGAVVYDNYVEFARLRASRVSETGKRNAGTSSASQAIAGEQRDALPTVAAQRATGDVSM